MGDTIPVKPGDVIQYAYLWAYEELEGHVEGRKERPCAVMIVHASKHVVGVCPITHTPPRANHGVQLPAQTCERLGLDDQAPCWVVTTELNQFVWPGPDIRRVPSGQHSYGLMPAALFQKIKAQLLANHAQGLEVVFRTDELD
ncbi:hypothetical protein [Wenzhouxiangella sp. EGI_FJ10305]|uniref:hypothetical protein n=1 Tax=Wenzhouxiangella sp. EGI_FJ10305 TaxID=3243768 RepID=UPI0035D646FB